MKNTENHYFVANYQWVIAWHDLTLEEAQAVLDRELEQDKENSQEREIIDENDD
mgnify:CR=1 FL=1